LAGELAKIMFYWEKEMKEKSRPSESKAGFDHLRDYRCGFKFKFDKIVLVSHGFNRAGLGAFFPFRLDELNP
jgi:hypothetical protein